MSFSINPLFVQSMVKQAQDAGIITPIQQGPQATDSQPTLNADAAMDKASNVARLPWMPSQEPQSTPQTQSQPQDAPLQPTPQQTSIIPPNGNNSALPSFLRGSMSDDMSANDAQGSDPSQKPVNPAQAAAQQANLPAPMTKGHKLLFMLKNGLEGAAVGSQFRNFGQGFEAAEEAPFVKAMRQQAIQKGGLENQLLGAQVQLAPWQRQAMILKLGQTQADIDRANAEAGKFKAEGGRATAESQAIPIKTALEKAQTEAAYYKEDPVKGLVDIRNGNPIGGDAGLAPLNADEAAVLGKNEGDKVPLKLKNTASEIVARDFSPAKADARYRSIVQNSQSGKPINQQDQAFKTAYERQKLLVPQTVANIRIAGMENTREYPVYDSKQKATIMVTPAEINRASKEEPGRYTSASFSPEAITQQQTAKAFSPGQKAGEEMLAFNTAISHADLLREAAKALNNGNVRFANSLMNWAGVEFGSDKATNFNTIAHVYTGEANKAITAGHVTEGELSKIGKTLPDNASPDQIMGTLNSYQGLMKSKADLRAKQYQEGIQGKPAFVNTQTQHNQPSTNTPNTPQTKQTQPTNKHSDIGVVYLNQHN